MDAEDLQKMLHRSADSLDSVDPRAEDQTPELLLAAGRRARRRRNRVRAVLGGTVAASTIAAAILGASLLDRDSSGATSPAEQVPTILPDPTPTPDPVPSIGPGRPEIVVDLTSIPTGPAPRMDWSEFTTLHTAEGEDITFGDKYSSTVPYRGGWLAGNNYLYTLERLDENQQVVSTSSGRDPVVNQDGTLVAWTEDVSGTGAQGVIHLADPNGSEPELQLDFNGDVVGFLGRDQVLIASGRPGDESGSGGDGTIYVTDGRTTPRPVVELAPQEQVLGVSSEAGLLVLDQPSCSRVVVIKSARTLLQDCDRRLTSLSPDGRFLASHPPSKTRLSAYGDTVAVVDTSSGAETVRFRLPTRGSFFLQTAFEGSSGDLLAVVCTQPGPLGLDGTYQVLRFSLDGSVEAASAPIEVPPYSGTDRLILHPRS